MKNTWIDFLRFKVEDFGYIGECARQHSEYFNEGPMDTKEFNKYVQEVGYDGANTVNQCESGWYAWFTLQWLMYWDKEDWWAEVQNGAFDNL